MIAGSARGTRLLAPGEGTRPLGDRVKQTLFSILEGGALVNWPVPFLDLFAGSGAGGIEALSRGSPRVTFVEHDANSVRTIHENLARARLDPGTRVLGEASGASVEVVQSDVLRFLSQGGQGGTFGAVLVDPPYGDAAMLAALEQLSRRDRGWLEGDALVVAKHFWRDRLPPAIGELEHRRERRFGETMLTFYQLAR